MKIDCVEITCCVLNKCGCNDPMGAFILACIVSTVALAASTSGIWLICDGMQRLRLGAMQAGGTSEILLGSAMLAALVAVSVFLCVGTYLNHKAKANNEKTPSHSLDEARKSAHGSQQPEALIA